MKTVGVALVMAVTGAAGTLADLDLARWHPEVPALLAGLARTTRAPGLPSDHDLLAHNDPPNLALERLHGATELLDGSGGRIAISALGAYLHARPTRSELQCRHETGLLPCAFPVTAPLRGKE